MCALCCTAFVVGCGGSDEEDDSIVAAFYPLAYAARNVAPETTVRDLTPPGAEPHDLELSARDVERLRDASLVVYAGEGFQPAVEEAVSGRSGPSLDVLDTVELLPERRRVRPARLARSAALRRGRALARSRAR